MQEDRFLNIAGGNSFGSNDWGKWRGWLSVRIIKYIMKKIRFRMWEWFVLGHTVRF